MILNQKKWGFGQYLGNTDDFQHMSNHNFMTSTGTPNGEDGNPNLDTTNMFGDGTQWYRWQLETGNCDSQPPVSGKKSIFTKDTGYAHQIMKYYSNDMIITYRGSDIANLGDYYKTYKDDNLTAFYIV